MIVHVENVAVQPEQNLIFTSKVNLLPSKSVDINFTTPSFIMVQDSSSKNAEANRLLQQGIETLNQGQVSEAQKYLQQALNIYRQIKDTLGEGETLKNLGNAYYLQADYAQAINYQQQALKIAQQIHNPDLESRALLNIGNAYRDWKKYPDGINYYQQSLVISRQSQIRQVEGIAIGNLGIAYYESKDYLKAVEILQQGLTIARSIEDNKLESLCLVYLGQVYNAMQEYAKAIEYYQQVLVISRKLDNRREEVIIVSALGLAYEKMGNNQKARDFYQLQLILAQGLNDKEQEIAARKNIERIQLPSNYQELEQVRQKLEQSRTSNNLPAVVLALIETGRIYNQQANYSEAAKALELGLQLTRDMKNSLLESQVLLEFGTTYSLQKKPDKAIELYKQTLAIAQQIKKTNNSQIKDLGIETERIALIEIATNYTLQGDLRQAIEYRQQDLAIAGKLKNSLREGQAIYALGNLYWEQDNYIQAINYFEQSLATGRKINNLVLQVQSLRILATAYLGLGDFEQAINYAEKTKKIVEEIDKPRQGQQTLSTIEIDFLTQLQSESLSLLGAAYLFGSASHDKAIGYFQQNLELARNLPSSNNKVTALTNAYQSLGSANAFLGKYDEAIKYYEEVLAVRRSIKEPQFEKINRQIEGANLQFLSSAYASKGDIKKSVEYAQESLAIAQEDNNLYGKAGALGNLGRTLFLAGNLPEAEKTLREAINIFESVRTRLGEKDLQKVSFFEIYTDVYELLQQVLIAQNKSIAALEIAEQGRAKSFSELLVSRAGLTKIPNASLNLEQIKKVAKEQNATLVEYSIIYNSSQALVPARIQGLQPNQESKLYIWVVQPTGEVEFRSIDLKKSLNTSLAKLVTSSRNSIGVRGRKASILTELIVNEPEQKNRLQQLHKLLIDPIADILPKDPNSHVIFIPQGQLFLVPFPALQDANGKYLIEKHTILTAPAIQVLNLTHQQKLKPQPANLQAALIVGNPTMPKVATKLGDAPQQLSNLAGAEAEANEIAKLFKTKAFTGNQAIKAKILPKLSQARIIHLATHGLLDDFKGLGVPGAIALAPSGNGELNDGLLTANEILDLKLNADLIVLSACDTGGGKITGDGVIGLSRSLITAGTPSVIVSLWSVPDAPTAELMTEFYRNWQQRKLNKAQALRQAMLTTMKNHPKPKDWAAFTLIGEAK
jgi:CHAT domain-containing protein/uncharacterized protein HemY